MNIKQHLQDIRAANTPDSEIIALVDGTQPPNEGCKVIVVRMMSIVIILLFNAVA